MRQLTWKQLKVKKMSELYWDIALFAFALATFIFMCSALAAQNEIFNLNGF